MSYFVSYASLVEFPGSVVLDGIVRESYDSGLQTFRGYATGSPVPEWVSSWSQMPTFQLTSQQILFMLTQGPGNAYAFCGGPIDLGFRTLLCPLRAGTNIEAHLNARVTDALVTLDRITATLDEPATAEMTIHALFDGSTPPVVFDQPVSITDFPAGFFDQIFGIGPVWLHPGDIGTFPDSILLEGIQSTTIEFNNQIEIIRSDGDVWPTWISVKTQEPTITIETVDSQQPALYKLEGNTPIKCRVTLRRHANFNSGLGVGVYDNASPVHVLLDVHAGLVSIKGLNVPGINEKVMTTLEIQPVATDNYFTIEYGLGSIVAP